MKIIKEGRNPLLAATVVLLVLYLNFFGGNYVRHGVVDINIFSHGNWKFILIGFAAVPVYFVAKRTWNRIRKIPPAKKGGPHAPDDN